MWYLHKGASSAKASMTEEPDAGKLHVRGSAGGRPVTGVPTAEAWKNASRIAWNPCYHEGMIASFNNQATEDIFNGTNSKAGRKALPITLWRIARRKLDQLDSVQDIEELRMPPGNQLESLIGDREGEYSIRINDQYRISFNWNETGPFDVEITDYH